MSKMNVDNALAFPGEIFYIYSVFFSKFSTAWNLIIFNNGEVTDVLAWPPNDFYVRSEQCLHRKTTIM